MSDDLVSRLLDEHTRILDLWSERRAAATALTEARSEIERLRDLLGDPEGTIAHANAITARADALESELSTFRARVREVVGPFASPDLLECKDCVDNDGKHYQSQWLANALRAARQLMEEVK